jgi:GNAT superfamily N-acetyltransferase
LTVTLEVIDPRSMTHEFARAAIRLDVEAWPQTQRDAAVESAHISHLYKEYRGDHRLEPRWIALRLDGRLVAEAATEPRVIRSGYRCIDVMALSTVCVDSRFRGRGFGATVVKAAFHRIDVGDFAFALWQTSLNLRSFYERLGASEVTNRFINSQSETDPAASPWWDDIPMRYPSASADWPDGLIDLQGPAF